MHSEQHRLRKLDAALRLRSLQRTRAELHWQCAARKLALAVQSWQAESLRYLDIVSQQQKLLAQGMELNPAMQSQRVLALSAARSMLAAKQIAVIEARALLRSTKAAWMKTRSDADAADNSRQRVALAVVQLQQAAAQADIADARHRQGG